MKLITRCFLFCFIFGIATTAYAGKPFDDFSGSQLDPAKWKRGSEPLEMMREHTGGVFESYSRAHLEQTDFPYVVFNDMPMADPNSINTLSADVTVFAASISEDVEVAGAGIFGSFYDEAGGTVQAGLQIGLTPTGYTVHFYIYTPSNGFVTVTPFTFTIEETKTYNLKIMYDNNTQFTFSVLDGATLQTRIVDAGVAKTGPPSDQKKRLATSVWGDANQTNPTGEGMVYAEFDNVVTNTFTDDFEGELLPAKWQGYEMQRGVDNGQAIMALANLGNNGRTQLDLPPASQDLTTKYTKADITIAGNSFMGTDTHGQFRIWGIIGNYKYSGLSDYSQDGAVYVYNKIFQMDDGSLFAEASVSHCTDETCDGPTWVSPFKENFSCIIQHDAPTTLSMEQIGNTMIFTCGSEIKTYTYPTPLYPYSWKARSLRSRVYSDSGNPGYLNVKVDNYFNSKVFPWASFLPPILKGTDN